MTADTDHCRGTVPSLVVGKSRSQSESPWVVDCASLFAALLENLHRQKIQGNNVGLEKRRA